MKSPLTNNTVYDLTDDEAGASTSGALPAAGGLRSVVIQNGSAAGPRAVDAPAPAPPPAPAAAAPACAPAAATTTPAAPAPAPTSAATTTQVTGEQIGLQESTPIVTVLDPGLLCLLGDEPEKEETFGPCIHDDISTRWSDILVNGRSRTVDIEGFKLEGAAVVGVAAAASPESPDASEDELHAWRAQTAAAVPPRERPPSAAAAAARPDLAPLASDADTQPQAVKLT
ncbi:dihydrolipoyllysine-residue acetyltransferase component of pyruvate dehydrogenase complex-like [Leguminivora glycinivorella]|uniref:dihydrolipoyllysine-residue acetyltransferase component of pyruvate dehydrogenase complex-like n=1 Tax=Leguminivora glycinivorella TaxID=1035111 RepID=UPI00200BA390|nr:dihydrolipoyllysine-residue acetyltransferase component of pyruvate dehydrogenase complex-like [Leguminivora glycinivorella]